MRLISEARRLISSANLNEQSLLDVLGEIEEDLNLGDDSYLVVLKSYLSALEHTRVVLYATLAAAA